VLDFKKLVLFFGLFCLCLVNHTIFAWALGLGLLLTSLFLYKIKISAKAAKELFVLLLIILLGAIHFQFFVIGSVNDLYSQAFSGKFAGLVLVALVWFSLRVFMLSKHKDKVVTLLQPLLLLNVVVFYVQFSTYFLTGYYLDLLQPFTGEPSRYLSFDRSLAGIGSFRPTGFYAEPSNYFMVVLALLSLLCIYKKFKVSPKLLAATVISMYLSFSTAAVIVATIFLIYFLYVNKDNARYFWGLGLVVLLVTITNLSTLERLYDSQANKFENSSGMRLKLVELAANREFGDAVLASGLFAIDNDIHQATQVSKYERREAGSLADSGFLVYLWVTLGYLGILLFLYICLKMKKAGRYRLPLFLIFSLTKLSLLYPLLVLYLVISLSLPKNQERNENTLRH